MEEGRQGETALPVPVILPKQRLRSLARSSDYANGGTAIAADFVQIEILPHQEQFLFFRRLLNFDEWRIAGAPKHAQFLDYQIVNSDIEAERDHLRVGDHIVRILTMKEAIGETRPLALDALLKLPANFYAVEWVPLSTEQARKAVNKRRRHFNISKAGFVSQLGNDTTRTNPRDVLVDESKQADIEDLGDCLRALGDGQQLGEFSLTIVLYGKDRLACSSQPVPPGGTLDVAFPTATANVQGQSHAGREQLRLWRATRSFE